MKRPTADAGFARFAPLAPLASLCLLLTASPVVSAADLHVPGDFPTIQVAINLAANDDVILVAPGTYFEALSFNGKRLTLRGTDGAESTIINALGRFEPVITINGSSSNFSVIEGVTLINGNATDAAPGERGGGIYSNNSSIVVRDTIITQCVAVTGGAFYSNTGAQRFENVRFIGNTATGVGGAVYQNNADVIYEACVFEGNSAGSNCGGVFVINNRATINGSVFRNNDGAARGGAVEVVAGRAFINDSSFIDNVAGDDMGEAGRGGAVYAGGSTVIAEMTNCLFLGNFAGSFGGALYAGQPMLALNCTFVGNTTTAGIEGVVGSTEGVLRNCVAWDNGASSTNSGTVVTYSLIEGGFAGTGNIGGDTADEPIFVDAMGMDFRLAEGSPGIDAGDASVLPITLTADFNGENRVINGLMGGAQGVAVLGYFVDMGAFEFQPASMLASCAGDANGDGAIDLADLNAVLSAFGTVCP